jgi:hypothetical protein
MSGDACRGHRAWAVRQQGRCGALRRDLGHVMRLRSTQGAPHPMGYGARVPTGAHGCCGCGVAPPERPSPLWLCSDLSWNALTGSVPSSLSALTNLAYLCVAPSCQWRLLACGRGGSDRSALLRARGMSGVDVGGIEGVGAAAGLLRYSQRGGSGTPRDYGVLKGHPLPWVRCAGTVGAHGCCGCGVAPPKRPSPLRVCSALNGNALTGSVPSSLSALTKLSQLCVAPSCQRRLRVRLMLVRIGRHCSERAACRRVHVGGIEPVRCGSRAVAVLSEGTSGTRCDYRVLIGHPSCGYGARVP